MLRQPLACAVGSVPLLMTAIIKLNNFCLSHGDDGDWVEDEQRYGSAAQVPIDELGRTINAFSNTEVSAPIRSGSSTQRREELANFVNRRM